MPVRVALDIPIGALIAELGFDTPPARVVARQTLEAAGLTRPGKTSVSAQKRPRIASTLSAALARSCGEPDCDLALAASGRVVVPVKPGSCERCAGSVARRSASRLSGACRAHGTLRVVVLGGSPQSRKELVSLRVGGLEIRAIDGTARRTIDAARADCRWADVVVIWASTQLDHRVSTLYSNVANGRLLLVTRRGVAALLDALSERLASRGRREWAARR